MGDKQRSSLGLARKDFLEVALFVIVSMRNERRCKAGSAAETCKYLRAGINNLAPVDRPTLVVITMIVFRSEKDVDYK
jgi:hypothetical protein